MPNPVLRFVEGVREALRKRILKAPEPPTKPRSVPGAFAVFMDENEKEILYQKPWPYSGVPTDDHTGRSEWMIEGRLFTASRRDRHGNWIFRRCTK